MSLRSNRILNGVHPWVKEGVQLVQDWLNTYYRDPEFGITPSIIPISGYRTVQRQAELYRTRGTRPVARAGCSQHNYGFALDYSVVGPTRFDWMGVTADLMRAAGFQTVVGDDGHVQAYPGLVFQNWARAAGYCDPTPIRLRRDPRPSSSQTQLVCGTDAVGSSCNHLTGCTCFY